MDPEPERPDAQQTPSTPAPGARKPAAARKPAKPRGSASTEPASDANPLFLAPDASAVTDATGPAPAAKPRTPAARKAPARTTTPRATTPRTTTPRATTPRATEPASPGATDAAAQADPKTPDAKPAVRKPAARKPAAPRTAPEAANAQKDPALEKTTKPRSTTPRAKAASAKVPAAAEPSTADAVTADAASVEVEASAAPKKKPAARKPAQRKPVASVAATALPAVEIPLNEAEPAMLVAEPAPLTAEEAQPAAVTEPERVPTPVPATAPEEREIVLRVSGLVKRFDDTTAVAGIDLEIAAGTLFGIVGPNGAGKTTTLSMVTGLLKPDAGTVTVHGADVWSNPTAAKRSMGVLPDRLRLFDRLTGAQLLYYSGILHGLDKKVVRSRSDDLAAAFGLEDALDRLVTDYSAGMTKKVAIAAALIHSPRLLILDEPFESVDPVSAANVIEILQRYVAAGGTVVMSSHTMNLIERICDSVAVVVNGAILATGTMAQVRGTMTLEERFVELAGGRKAAEGMEWLHKFSD